MESEDFKTRLDQLKQVTVLKHGKIFQALLYLLGYSWDSVVEPGT